MKIAMLFAHWRQFGETWSTPHSWQDEFIARGHEVTVYNLYHNNGELHRKTRMRQYSDEGLNQLHMDVTRGTHYDMIYVLDYGPWQSLRLSHKYFPDSVLVKECGDEPQANQLHYQTAPQFDIVLTPDKRCAANYCSIGVNAVWQTHFADTRIFYPRSDIPVAWDCVTTCGPRGNGLTDKIQAALGARFNNERYFFGEDHAKRLSMGKIVFQKSQYGEITRRVFEGMACGKMVITDRLSVDTGLSSLLTDGQDIVYYDNAEDAIEKIDFYANHDAAREAIAKNGYEKVFKYHSIGAKVSKLTSLSSGVFQVTARNSVEVSDYGSYDTSTIAKKVTATVRADFSVR
jgi:hypothetical protein